MAGTRTFYVSEDGARTWQRAQEHARTKGQSMSRLVEAAIRLYLQDARAGRIIDLTAVPTRELLDEIERRCTMVT